MTACARGGVRFSESRGSRASTQLGRKRGRKERDRGKRKDEEGAHQRRRIRVGSLSRSPRGPAGLARSAARNAHLKRGRNGRGAPGVFLTRIPDVRASHLFVLLLHPAIPRPPRLLLLFATPSRPVHSSITIWLLDPLELPYLSFFFFFRARRRFFLLA